MGGIETRVIVQVNQVANQFESSIVIHINEKYIDVKSILGLSLTLMTEQTYRLEIHGPDEVEAKEALKRVFSKHHLDFAMNE